MTALSKLIHTGFGRLGIRGDAEQRAVLVRATGKPSLRDMVPAEEEAVVAELERLGFKRSSKRANGRLKLSGKYAGKLQALWIAGWNLGVFHERDDAALEAFVKRQTGIERERWLHHAEDAKKVIEALKKWLAREGGVDWSNRKYMLAEERADGYRIAAAQWRILNQEADQPMSGFWYEVWGVRGVRLGSDADLTASSWIAVMNAFGVRIRAAAKKGGA